jgi:hypothetical protein
MVICAFDTSLFEVTVIFDVPISLAVYTLSNRRRIEDCKDIDCGRTKAWIGMRIAIEVGFG